MLLTICKKFQNNNSLTKLLQKSYSTELKTINDIKALVSKGRGFCEKDIKNSKLTWIPQLLRFKKMIFLVRHRFFWNRTNINNYLSILFTRVQNSINLTRKGICHLSDLMVKWSKIHSMYFFFKFHDPWDFSLLQYYSTTTTYSNGTKYSKIPSVWYSVVLVCLTEKLLYW